jgi:hypothetical protein
VLLLFDKLVFVVISDSGAFLGASNSVVDVCPKLHVKVSVIAFKTRLVEAS